MSKRLGYFTKTVQDWHKSVERDLPWKNTGDAYHIWVSEIILQQTRVEQGRPYYLNFIKQFPTVSSLAQAPVEEVLKIWEGLGYYSRARNMHEAAKDIVWRFDGRFPDSYDDILSLKGIGTYTASAIASFAFGLPHAVVDGNVIRVLSRYFGYAQSIDSSKGKKYVDKLAQQCLNFSSPGAYNQAIMDFGSLQCKPRNPVCSSCVLGAYCSAYRKNLVDVIPVKEKKTRVRERYFHYFIYQKAGEIFIQQRTEGDIWAKLHEFPLFESSKSISLRAAKKEILHQQNNINLSFLSKKVHRLSHQLLHISFYKIDGLCNSPYFEKGRLEKVEELHTFAFPRPLYKFLNELDK